MSRKLSLTAVLITVVVLWFGVGTAETGSCESELEAGFADPPMSARPRAYWDWMNGYVNLSQLTRELEDAKEKGMSGFDIFDIGARDRQKIVPAGPAFMGPEWVESAGYAIREATRLGLRLGFITSSSWNAGGSWVTPEMASKALYASETRVTGPAQFSQVLVLPKVPIPKFGRNRVSKTADDKATYRKDIAVLAFGWNEEKLIKDTSSVVDLTGQMNEAGRLSWDVPAGEWIIMRFVCANNRERVTLPSPNSEGLMIDHFSPTATKWHFEYIMDRLQAEVGDFEDTALDFLYLPSYEIRGTKDWTPTLMDEFKKRRGYDMIQYLPVLFGWTVENKEIADRFEYDRLKTVADLIIENHYAKGAETCRKYGLKLCAESGGPGPPMHDCPVEALRALGVLDIVRGEFWNKHTTRMVKEIACAAHIYGKKVVDMEALTSWLHWQQGPADYKPVVDLAMCGGTNLFTFHTSPHTPPEAGKPGWAYHAGTHMGMTRAWWPKVKPFIDYLSRCSYLLQQGLFVGDVCYYYGDHAPNFVPNRYDEHPPDFTPQRRLDPSLGYGYDYDVTNTDVLVNRMDAADNGRVALPDGMSYELLVLPERDDMPLEVLRKLERLVRTGVTVVGPRPTRTNGLGDYRKRDKKLRKLADKLWGPCDGDKVKEHSYGKGKVIWGRTLRQILQERGIGPDFSYSGQDKETRLDYIHRCTDGADIYFVRNENMRTEQADCVFRVTGKVPELWLPDTGEIRKHLIYDSVEGGTKVSLRLGPAGSVFVVFREKAKENHIVSVSAKPSSACIEILPGKDDNVELLAYKGGTYVLETARGVSKKIEVESVPSPVEVAGSWKVYFPYGWGAEPVNVFDELISWTEHPNDGVKYFSGIATYHKEFEIPADMVGDDKQLVLDLGGVRNVAEVYFNGRNLGILWKQPFQVDISSLAKPGKNWLVVEVANVWSNRIVGDIRLNLPRDKRYTRTNLPCAINSRHIGVIRWKDAPLLESGLLGPVRVIPAKKIEVKL